MDDDALERALELLRSTSLMLLGMTLDPAIPQHAKDALLARIDRLDNFVEGLQE